MPGPRRINSNSIPGNRLFKNMTYLEQFVEHVTNYSSKYSCLMSVLYSPVNLIGKPSEYPQYGDFPDTYMLRTYGKWWKEREAAQQHYNTQDIDPIDSEDFVTVSFEYAVIPSCVCIYETYNPGAVVRIWGRNLNRKWILLWQMRPSLSIQTSNIFRPKIKEIREPIKALRIEFNQSLLQYHTAIDAVLLAGYKSDSLLQSGILNSGLLENFVKQTSAINGVEDFEYKEGCDNFSKLPYEAVLHIFKFLDLASLCRCAQVNSNFYNVSCDSSLYRKLSLKRYWNKVNGRTLRHLMKKCQQIKKLDITWCGSEKQISQEAFIKFLQQCCKKITHLSAGNCNFIEAASLKNISSCTDLTELRLRNIDVSGNYYLPLACLNKLVTLDLYSTHILDDELISILIANEGLKHIIIDFCENLQQLDQVAETVRNHNRNLITWSSWKTYSLSSVGVQHLSYCSNLRELDLGWTLMLGVPGNCLERVAVGCKDLRRLVISGWRSVTDHLLLPIIRSCKQLTQLDLLGLRDITAAIGDRILESLPKLELLDISFCESIDDIQVLIWREQYPKVTIQRSNNGNGPCG